MSTTHALVWSPNLDQALDEATRLIKLVLLDFSAAPL
jgi:hypothetical protein